MLFDYIVLIQLSRANVNHSHVKLIKKILDHNIWLPKSNLHIDLAINSNDGRGGEKWNLCNICIYYITVSHLYPFCVQLNTQM